MVLGFGKGTTVDPGLFGIHIFSIGESIGAHKLCHRSFTYDEKISTVKCQMYLYSVT